MISTILTLTLYGALATNAVLIGYAVWRVWQGENTVDRLMAFELIATLMPGVLVLIALIEQNSIFIDIALGLAALGFIAVVAFAKYVAVQRVYRWPVKDRLLSRHLVS